MINFLWHSQEGVKATKIKFKGRYYITYDKADFQEELQDITFRDPNAIWVFLKSATVGVLDPFCSIKTFCVSEARELWVTNEVLQIIRHTGSEEHWVRARRARNKVGSQVENVKVRQHRSVAYFTFLVLLSDEEAQALV